MTKTIQIDLTLELATCIYEGCGFTFAIPKDWRERLRQDHGRYYCPSCGRAMVYLGESAEEKAAREAREQLASAKQQLSWANERADRNRRDAEHFEASRNAYKGQVTKLKNRAAHGVCPCCNRTFAALERHMKTKHPEFVAETNTERGQK